MFLEQSNCHAFKIFTTLPTWLYFLSPHNSFDHFLLSQMLQRQQEFQEQQQSTAEQTETTKELQQPGVNPDAMEILHVKKKKTIHTTFKQAKTTKSITSQSVASHSTTSQSISNQSTKKQSIMSQSHADESTARQMSENRAITDQAAAKSGTM